MALSAIIRLKYPQYIFINSRVKQSEITFSKCQSNLILYDFVKIRYF